MDKLVGGLIGAAVVALGFYLFGWHLIFVPAYILLGLAGFAELLLKDYFRGWPWP